MADKVEGIADNSLPNNRNDGRSGNRKRKHTNHLYSINDNNLPKMKLEFVREDAIGYGYFNDDNIKVKMPSGKIKSFKVKESDTFGKLKVKIQADENIPFDHQELIYNGTVQLDKDTLSNLFMEKDCILTLMTKSNGLIKILIADTFDTHSINVRPDITIGDIKSMVFGSFGDEEVLIFNETVLEDSGTLAEYNIIDGSTLTVMGVSIGNMDIKVDLYTGKTITLSVKPTNTIADVKDDIQDEEDIHPDEQVLIFDNMVLGDHGTLFDFGINRTSTLKLMHRPWEFTIPRRICIRTLSGEIITQEVDPLDTIADVKAMIQDKVNVPCGEQELIFNEMVLSDMDTVADFHIIGGSTLTLMHKPRGFRKFMKIFIKTLDGETITQEVKPSDTIGDLKTKIREKVDVPCHEQELIFNEMVMSDADTLADFNINKDSTLTLMRISSGLMCIFVKVPRGKAITLDVRPSNTIDDVKSKIFDMGKISKNWRDLGFLTFNGKRLEEGAILADYDIPKKSTVHLTDGRDSRIPKINDAS